MPECVRRHTLCDPGLSTYLRRIFHAPMRESGSPRELRNRIPFPLSSLQLGAKLARVNGDGADRTCVRLGRRVLSTLSENPHQMLVHQHVTNADGNPLGYAKTRAYASSSIARSRNASGSSSDGAFDQPFDFLGGENFRKRAPSLWCFQPLARIAHECPSSSMNRK